MFGWLKKKNDHLGRLIREANAEFNGNRSKSKMLVSSDFEDKCFHIDFDVEAYP
jgi:hypothetical protein